MRRFFVYFLLLGVFTLTTQLVSADIAARVTGTPNSELVGSWEMVSIDGKSVTEHLWQTVSIDDKPFMEYLWERVQLSDKSVAELLGGELSSIETKVTQNDFVLFENGSWFWTFGLNMEADLGGGVSLIPTMSLANRGSYTPLPEDSDGTTTNFVREVIKIHLEPEDFWETAAVEVSEEDIRRRLPGLALRKGRKLGGAFRRKHTYLDEHRRNKTSFKTQRSTEAGYGQDTTSEKYMGVGPRRRSS